MSNVVPEGWKFNSIGECCEILDSKRVPLNSEERAKRLGNYPYYGANGIQGYIDSFIFDCDAILVAEDGGNFDQYAERPIAQWVTGKYWVNNHAHIIRAKENNLHKWIYYCLVHKNILKFINGGTRSKLNQSDLREIRIPLPTLPEQKKIVSILTSVDEVIDNTQKQIDKLQDLKKATMNELLTKGIGHTEFKDSELGRIPKSWSLKKLGDLSNIFFSNVDKKTEESETEVLLCNYMDVYSNRNINKRIEFMQATAKKREIDKFKISKGDVLITKDSETPADIAIPSYVSEELHNVLCGYHLALIRPHRNNLSGRFLYYLFSFDKIQHRYYQLANGTTRFGLTAKIITDTPLPIPPLIEQKEIATIIISVDQKIEILVKKLQQTKSLKKSLMQDLLTGKIKVSVN